MAESLDGEKKDGRKKLREDKMGHNIADIRAKAQPLMEELLQLQKDMDSDMGEYKSDFKRIYEKGANSIGCAQSVLRKEFRRLLKNLRQEEDEQQMDTLERAQTETLRAAMVGTPFEKYLEGKLAEASGR